MKKFAIIAIVIILLVVTGAVRAEGIVLTEELVKKFIDVYPEFDKLSKEIAKLNEKKPDNEEKTKLVMATMEKRTALVKEKGWEDEGDFISFKPRIIPIMTSFTLKEKVKKIPAQGRKAMEDAIKDLQKDYSQEEITVMMKYEKQIRQLGFIQKT